MNVASESFLSKWGEREKGHKETGKKVVRDGLILSGEAAAIKNAYCINPVLY